MFEITMRGLLNALIFNHRENEANFEMFHAELDLVSVGKAANSSEALSPPSPTMSKEAVNGSTPAFITWKPQATLLRPE